MSSTCLDPGRVAPVIRQLRRLTRAVPAFGPGVAAIAVYAEASPGRLRRPPAAESGFEGVACVDDAARLASLYITLWRHHEFPWARPAALEMLGFVRAMQTPEGWFANFICDWEGTKNLTGCTSGEPGGPWLARACHALAAGAVAFADERCARALERAWPWLQRSTPHLGLRAVALLAALELCAGTRRRDFARQAQVWAMEIYEACSEGLLPDVRGSTDVHLWGHLQECALAEAGRTFGRPDWIRAARESADGLLVPAAEGAFAGRTSIPFDVSCTIRGLESVGRATGDSHYAGSVRLARAWFDGRNAASAPVLDRGRGLVHDGIDDGRVNANSGAEANIEAGLALAGAPARGAHCRDYPGADPCPGDSKKEPLCEELPR